MINPDMCNFSAQSFLKSWQNSSKSWQQNSYKYGNKSVEHKTQLDTNIKHNKEVALSRNFLPFMEPTASLQRLQESTSGRYFELLNLAHTPYIIFL
jgi:hypothetical protein